MLSLIGDALGIGADLWKHENQKDYDRETKKAARRKLKEEQQRLENFYANMLADNQQFYDSRPSLGSEEDVASYRNAILGYDPSAYDDVEEYSFDKSVEDYVNPYYDAIIGATTDALQHTAAGAGLGRGTGAAQNIAEGVAQKSDELYKTAYDMYNTDRNQDYNEFIKQIELNRAKIDSMNKAQESKLNALGTLSNDYLDALDMEQATKNSIKQDQNQATNQYMNTLATLY